MGNFYKKIQIFQTQHTIKLFKIKLLVYVKEWEITK